LIEDLKIEDGPLASILTGTSLHGGLVDAWPLSEATAKQVLPRLQERWQREGLPQYAQFDNGTQFQGAHQWPDATRAHQPIVPSFGCHSGVCSSARAWLSKCHRRL